MPYPVTNVDKFRDGTGSFRSAAGGGGRERLVRPRLPDLRARAWRGREHVGRAEVGQAELALGTRGQRRRVEVDALLGHVHEVEVMRLNDLRPERRLHERLTPRMVQVVLAAHEVRTVRE